MVFDRGRVCWGWSVFEGPLASSAMAAALVLRRSLRLYLSSRHTLRRSRGVETLFGPSHSGIPYLRSVLLRGRHCRCLHNYRGRQRFTAHGIAGRHSRSFYLAVVHISNRGPRGLGASLAATPPRTRDVR